MQVLRSSVRAGVIITSSSTNANIDSWQNKLFSSVLVVCQRSRTSNPLGGDSAEYCKLLARTNAKGKLSSVNLRKRHQRALLRQAVKQTLQSPSRKKQQESSSSSESSESNTISLEVFKKELESLIKRNRIYTNRRAQREKLHTRVFEKAKHAKEHNLEKTSQESGNNNVRNCTDSMNNTVDSKNKTKEMHKKCNPDEDNCQRVHDNTHDNERHDSSQSDILSAHTRSIINDVNSLECSEQEQELQYYYSTRQNEQFGDEEHFKKNRNIHSSIDSNSDKSEKHHNKVITSPSLLAEVEISNNSVNTCKNKTSKLNDKEIKATGIEKCDNNNDSNNSNDTAECIDTQQYERDLEHHFAISPQCTIFGSDLDRLEYDMMREFHQCGQNMPKVDSAYSHFGVNRRGRRLRWEPSSSFDIINASVESFSNNSESSTKNNTKGHEMNKYHMSPLHMYAEAYAKEQEERAKARANSNGNMNNKCMGINYCKCDIASRCTKAASKPKSDYNNKDNNVDNEVASCNNRNVDEQEDGGEDLPADVNPHFPCENTNNNSDNSNSYTSSESNSNNENKANTSHELNNGDWSWLYLHSNYTRAEKEIVIDGRTAFRSKLVIHDAEKSNNDSSTNSNNNNSLYVTNNGNNQEDDDHVIFDAFYQRPSETALIKTHGYDYWHNYSHWQQFMQHSSYRERLVENEELTEGVVDTCLPDFNLNELRKNMMRFTQKFPVNEMIQESFVRIRSLRPRDGSPRIKFNTNLIIDNSKVTNDDDDNDESESNRNTTQTLSHSHSTDTHFNNSNSVKQQQSILRGSSLSLLSEEERRIVEQIDLNVDIPIHEARQMARKLGLDLIRFGVWYGNNKTGSHAVALCTIADYREYMREDLEFTMKKLGVNPPRTPECIEVGFRGGTLPHAIRVKAIGIAKHLLHRHAIRINLTEFGTPKEGFPILQVILDEIKRQATRLNAFHTAGIIQANYNEIFCYLYPPTGRSPKVKVSHPSPEEICNARDFYHLQNDKKIYFDGVNEQLDARERLAYLHKIENGTAWAHFDDGLSLQRQRRLKIMLGYLPKGNKDIYAARGDVNLPQPFRTSHITSIHNLIYPRESNIEQACRGAAVLGKRAGMHVSDMHDSGETSDNSSTLNRSYYRVEGPALEIGELKEALGLKDNRKRHIPLAPGFATLGVSTRESNKFEIGEKAK